MEDSIHRNGGFARGHSALRNANRSEAFQPNHPLKFKLALSNSPSWTALADRRFGKPFVAQPGVNTKLVNRSAPDLFPA